MNSELSDGQVCLRRFMPADAAPLHEAVRESLAEMTPWMRWCERDFSLADSAEWIHSTDIAWQQDQAYNFAIIELASGRLVGSIWLSRLHRKHCLANVGYWVRTSAAGRGIATAAARLLTVFGIERLGLNRLEVLVAVGNRASERVAEKIEAHREGVLRQRLWLEGKPRDAVSFSFLAGDLKT